MRFDACQQALAFVVWSSEQPRCVRSSAKLNSIVEFFSMKILRIGTSRRLPNRVPHGLLELPIARARKCPKRLLGVIASQIRKSTPRNRDRGGGGRHGGW